jgi:mRNA-degrading endonuclease RelE of RelBE toxin-antitoxin system
MSARTIYYHPLVLEKDAQYLDRMVWDFIRGIIRKKLVTDAESFGKPLRNVLRNARVLRVGGWRVVFQIVGDAIHVCTIRHRREGYRGIETRFI